MGGVGVGRPETGASDKVQQPTRLTVTAAGKEPGCSPHTAVQRTSRAEATIQPQEPAHIAAKPGDRQRSGTAVW